MAIAFDATSSGATASSTQLTFTHTCGGDNRVLFVFCKEALGGAAAVQTASYGGSSMTLLHSGQTSSGRWGDVFYLAGPSSGANTVDIRLEPADFCDAGAASYTGAAQTSTGPEAENISTGSASTFTATVTTITDNAWGVSFLFGLTGQSTTAGAGVGRIQGDGNTWTWMDNGPITPAGAANHAITQTAGSVDAASYSVAPFSAGAATVRVFRRFFTGVG